MDLFAYIPDAYVPEVFSIVNNDDWDNVMKLDALKTIVDSDQMLKMVKDYLETKVTTT